MTARPEHKTDLPIQGWERIVQEWNKHTATIELTKDTKVIETAAETTPKVFATLCMENQLHEPLEIAFNNKNAKTRQKLWEEIGQWLMVQPRKEANNDSHNWEDPQPANTQLIEQAVKHPEDIPIKYIPVIGRLKQGFSKQTVLQIAARTNTITPAFKPWMDAYEHQATTNKTFDQTVNSHPILIAYQRQNIRALILMAALKPDWVKKLSANQRKNLPGIEQLHTVTAEPHSPNKRLEDQLAQWKIGRLLPEKTWQVWKLGETVANCWTDSYKTTTLGNYEELTESAIITKDFQGKQKETRFIAVGPNTCIYLNQYILNGVTGEPQQPNEGSRSNSTEFNKYLQTDWVWEKETLNKIREQGITTLSVNNSKTYFSGSYLEKESATENELRLVREFTANLIPDFQNLNSIAYQGNRTINTLTTLLDKSYQKIREEIVPIAAEIASISERGYYLARACGIADDFTEYKKALKELCHLCTELHHPPTTSAEWVAECL